MKIAIIVVVCLAVGVNVFASFLEKYYKNKALKNSKNNED